MACKIIAIIGEAGSGKDTLMKKALSAIPELNEIISCTTRPPREGETDGINYNFISEEEFKQQRFLESTSFNGWMYGTPYNALSMNKINIGVFNPSGVRELLKNKNFDVKVYWVRASDKERLLRQLNREKSPNIKEIIRRFDADNEDFSDIDFSYHELLNNNLQDLKLNVAVIKRFIEDQKILDLWPL